MSQARTFLLRLREADVVRLCGLEAAARGLDLATRHAVGSGRRIASQLEAIVTDEASVIVSVELAEDGASHLVQWHCSRDAAPPLPAADVAPGCSHVAAVLTAWIRAPADFAVPPNDLADVPRDVVRIPAPHPRLAQPPLLPPAAPKHTHTGVSLADELARLPGPEAVAIARRVLGVNTDEYDARTLLTGTLRDPRQVAALLARLDHSAAALFTDIELMGTAVTAADLDTMADRMGRPHSALRADLAVLERHGLIFRAASASAGAVSERTWRQFTGWRIPPELRAAHTPTLPLAPLATADPHGPPLLPETASVTLTDRHRAAHIQRGSARPLCLALALLARAPRPYSPVAVPSTGKETSRAAAPRAAHQPFPLQAGELAPPVLAEFARSAGVPPHVARLARRLFLWARGTPDAVALLDLASVPPSERAIALLAGFRLWRSMEAAAELADLNLPESLVSVRFDLSHEALRPAALAAEAANARSAVLRLLERVAPDTWYALEEFIQLVWRVAPLFLRSRQVTYAAPAWWLERRADSRPLRPAVRDEWLEGEGTYLRMLLTGPLVAWGVVDIGLDAESRPAAFRLTSFGRDLLSGTLSSSADPIAPSGGDWGPPVLLTRDAALAVHPLAAGPSLLDALEQWARVADIAGSRLVYTLDAERACTAFDHGVAFTSFLTSLRSLPNAERAAAAVRERISAWQARYGAARIERGWTLIEARDEATLAEALAQTPEIFTRVRRLAPSLVLVPRDDVSTLRAALTKRGYSL